MGRPKLTVSTIVDKSLSEDNYEYWKACLKNYLIGKGLWRVVSGKEAKPQRNDEKYEGWKQKNAMAFHAIQISCGPEVYDTLKKKNISAGDAWNLVAEKVRGASNAQKPPADDDSGTEESKGAYSDAAVHYRELWEAVNCGNLKATKDFLDRKPSAINAIISTKGNPPLHIAILAGHAEIAVTLVEMMQPKDLEMRSGPGWTALALAAINGHVKVAKAILDKNRKLATIESGDLSIGESFLPIIYAGAYGHHEMTRYLYNQTPKEILRPECGVQNGPLLLNTLIPPEFFDVALDLLNRYPRLGFCKDFYGHYAIRLLAKKPLAFCSGCKLAGWKQWIYSCIWIPPMVAAQFDEVSFHGPADEEKAGRPQKGITIGVRLTNHVLGVFRGLPWSCTKCLVPGIEHLYKRKLIHDQAITLLQGIVKGLPALSESELAEIDINQVIYDATKNGIVEFIVELIKSTPYIIWREDTKGRSMFAHAIVERQEKIYCLLHELGTKKSMIANRHDKFANNFLHLTAKLSPSSQLDQASGGAMQMQRELHWFKEVEALVQPKYREECNDHNKTPNALFSEEHKGLMQDGEKWMKNTAASCMVVATLIAAVMFTTTFTLPGGTDQAGVPIFLDYDAFMVFIVANALSLFSSSTSMLMFLGILTARYAEEDFLKELPTKLGLGLFSLFFSVVTMMMAFGSALFMYLHERLNWVCIPIIGFALIPVTLFVLLEFPLLIMMFTSTYGRGIFGRHPKRL